MLFLIRDEHYEMFIMISVDFISLEIHNVESKNLGTRSLLCTYSTYVPIVNKPDSPVSVSLFRLVDYYTKTSVDISQGPNNNK